HSRYINGTSAILRKRCVKGTTSLLHLYLILAFSLPKKRREKLFASSGAVRVSFGCASTTLRNWFESPSVFLCIFFGYCSGFSEQRPNTSRRSPEQGPNKSRGCPEETSTTSRA